MSAPNTILFGKLPSHADFVARGLAEVGRRAWDDWLSSRLDWARASLGARFAEAHEAAAPWRFVAGPGVFGPGWRAGCLAPSVDAVGRRFFVILAIDRLSGKSAAARGGAIAVVMEELIYRAFEGNLDADALALAAQDPPSAEDVARQETGPAAREAWWVDLGPKLEPILLDHPPHDLLSAARLAEEREAAR